MTSQPPTKLMIVETTTKLVDGEIRSSIAFPWDFCKARQSLVVGSNEEIAVEDGKLQKEN